MRWLSGDRRGPEQRERPAPCAVHGGAEERQIHGGVSTEHDSNRRQIANRKKDHTNRQSNIRYSRRSAELPAVRDDASSGEEGEGPSGWSLVTEAVGQGASVGVWESERMVRVGLLCARDFFLYLAVSHVA